VGQDERDPRSVDGTLVDEVDRNAVDVRAELMDEVKTARLNTGAA
jgi:hypothetical protein